MTPHTPTNHQIIDDFAKVVPAPSGAEFDSLRDRLVADADRNDLLDVAYRNVDSLLRPTCSWWPRPRG